MKITRILICIIISILTIPIFVYSEPSEDNPNTATNKVLEYTGISGITSSISKGWDYLTDAIKWLELVFWCLIFIFWVIIFFVESAIIVIVPAKIVSVYNKNTELIKRILMLTR